MNHQNLLLLLLGSPFPSWERGWASRKQSSNGRGFQQKAPDTLPGQIKWSFPHQERKALNQPRQEIKPMAPAVSGLAIQLEHSSIGCSPDDWKNFD
jgi:hypothetical protein